MKSIWSESCRFKERDPLSSDIETEIAVIGAGITGLLYPVDIRCPHLGCQLEWNPDERSWDCPCHGSRFDRFGKLISGPAQEDLARG